MTVVGLHKKLTYALILLPFVVLQLGGEINLLMTGVFLFGLLLSWFWEPYRAGTVWDRLWTVGTLLALVLTVLRMVQGGLQIGPLVDLTLLLSVFKLMQRRGPRDYAQLLALSFLLMTAGAAFNPGLVFGVAFVVYLLLGTLTMTVRHMHEELIRFRPEELDRFRLRGRFLVGVAGLSMGVFAVSVLLFLLFPRMGVGFFNTGGRAGMITTGFSESVQLGGHGRIRSNDAIVMRVGFPGQPDGRSPRELRWRGVAFDHYDGHQWQRRVHDLRGAWSAESGLYSAPRFRLQDAAGLVAQEVYLEPLDTDVLFGLPVVSGLSFPEEDPNLPRSFWRESVMISRDGEVRLRRPTVTGVHYIVYSAEEDPYKAQGAFYMPPAVADFADAYPTLARAGPRDNWDEAERLTELSRNYLQLPNNLTSRVAELAAQVISGATTPLERMQALEAYLVSEYAYTLDLPWVSPDNPLESFLFDTKVGHCEYFATALAILGRTVGIPTRNVNGFLGGEFNSVGDFYAIRQYHAHSWVEAYLPEAGWVTFEPTPPSGVPPSDDGDSVWDDISAFFDSMRMLWYQHVVDFDLEQQLSTAQGIVGIFASGDDVSSVGRIAFRLIRNIPVLSLSFLMWFGGAFWYVRRHQRGLSWDRVDLVFSVAWTGVIVALVAAFWRPRAGVSLLLISATVPGMTALSSWMTRAQRRRVRGGTSRRRLSLLSREYTSLVHAMSRFGYSLSGSEPPSALLRQAEARGVPYSEALAQGIQMYQCARFGAPAGRDEEAVRHLRKLRKAVIRSEKGKD